MAYTNIAFAPPPPKFKKVDSRSNSNDGPEGEGALEVAAERFFHVRRLRESEGLFLRERKGDRESRLEKEKGKGLTKLSMGQLLVAPSVDALEVHADRLSPWCKLAWF